MKTYLSDDKLAYFRERLLELKAETEKQISNLSTNKPPNDSSQERSDYGNHPADFGTEQFEQERDNGMKLVQQERLQAIDDALERINNKTYGMSVISQKPIPEERLDAIPTAKTLVEEE